MYESRVGQRESRLFGRECLNVFCDKRAEKRGLCPSCYGLAWKLVKRGRTTWDRLEDAGKIEPAKPLAPSKSSWFLAA